MQQVLLIFLLVLFGLYILLILYYWLSWRAIPNYKPQTPNLSAGASAEAGNKPQTKISVIIPARNEEENITTCLDSLSNQSYPKDLFEVLVVDDHSTDNTATIVKKYEAGNIKLISLKDFINDGGLNSYKKKAIEIAIQHSTGELIVTTDADCYVPENWLQTIAAFYEQHQPVFIAAPVAINCGPRFIEMFQALDFMALQGITGAAVYKKVHSMCNGANLAYTKKAFEEVGGFTGIDNIASGDDMLLMHKIYKRYPDKTFFLKSKEAVVQTAAVKTIGEFFNQRIRWASKADSYDDKRIFWALLLVYLFNLSLVFLPVWALFNNARFNIHLYPVSISISLAEFWVILLVIKLVIELLFLYPVAKFFHKQPLLWLFPLMQPLHIIYTVIAGWLGRFGSYKWKERRVKWSPEFVIYSMATGNFSFRAETWKRLKKNKGALFGLFIIIVAVLVSIFGYVIAPDNSTNADLQTVEIQARKPGYSQQFLKIPGHKKTSGQNWFTVLLYGKQNNDRYVPISGYNINGDSLFINKFIDNDTSVVQYYSINQLTNNNPSSIQNNIISKKFRLGTDKFGRDILSRLIIGTRVSLAVGLIAVLISLTLGIILGAIAGYYRGWIDELIMWLINVTWSIPTLLLVFAITMAMGKGFWQIFIAVGLTMWVSVARLIRGQVMAIKEMEYVQAAKALGLKNRRIIFRHILPNVLGPVMVIAAGNFATAIIVEAGLSFLGIGIQPPQPSWGLMIKENYNFIITHNPMLALIPGFAIMLLVLAFNLLGNGLRDAVDVKEG